MNVKSLNCENSNCVYLIECRNDNCDMRYISLAPGRAKLSLPNKKCRKAEYKSTATVQSVHSV